jgi:hypothetical protein
VSSIWHFITVPETQESQQSFPKAWTISHKHYLSTRHTLSLQLNAGYYGRKNSSLAIQKFPGKFGLIHILRIGSLSLGTNSLQ